MVRDLLGPVVVETVVVEEVFVGEADGEGVDGPLAQLPGGQRGPAPGLEVDFRPWAGDALVDAGQGLGGEVKPGGQGVASDGFQGGVAGAIVHDVPVEVVLAHSFPAGGVEARRDGRLGLGALVVGGVVADEDQRPAGAGELQGQVPASLGDQGLGGVDEDDRPVFGDAVGGDRETAQQLRSRVHEDQRGLVDEPRQGGDGRQGLPDPVVARPVDPADNQDAPRAFAEGDLAAGRRGGGRRLLPQLGGEERLRLSPGILGGAGLHHHHQHLAQGHRLPMVEGAWFEAQLVGGLAAADEAHHLRELRGGGLERHPEPLVDGDGAPASASVLPHLPALRLGRVVQLPGRQLLADLRLAGDGAEVAVEAERHHPRGAMVGGFQAHPHARAVAAANQGLGELQAVEGVAVGLAAGEDKLHLVSAALDRAGVGQREVLPLALLPHQVGDPQAAARQLLPRPGVDPTVDPAAFPRGHRQGVPGAGDHIFPARLLASHTAPAGDRREGGGQQHAFHPHVHLSVSLS